MDSDTAIYIILFLSVFNTIITIYFLYHFFKLFNKIVDFLIPDNDTFKYQNDKYTYDKDA